MGPGADELASFTDKYFLKTKEVVRHFGDAQATYAPRIEKTDGIVDWRLGASGIVLFSYDSLASPRQSASDYLAAVARAAFNAPHGGSTGSR